MASKAEAHRERAIECFARATDLAVADAIEPASGTAAIRKKLLEEAVDELLCAAKEERKPRSR